MMIIGLQAKDRKKKKRLEVIHEPLREQGFLRVTISYARHRPRPVGVAK
jgi:hypothetical protein